ncbi:hypothetical protein QUB19_15640 [Microcoleus sp. B4-C5]|uniref:hypothetical protein n=1 Tax=unclassified Microcoleus TaxID=2642155 RepID=UPI002FD70B39
MRGAFCGCKAPRIGDEYFKQYPSTAHLSHREALGIKFCPQMDFQKVPSQLLLILSRYQKPNIDRKRTSPCTKTTCTV